MATTRRRLGDAARARVAVGVISNIAIILRCEHLHHGWRDRHNGEVPCPVVARVIDAANYLQKWVYEQTEKSE